MKIKSLSLKIFNGISNFLRNTGLYKMIPYRAKLYDFLFQRLWFEPNIIEIQGSKMYIDVHNKSPEMRKTFQAYASNLIHEKATTDLFKKTVKEGDVIVDLGANIGYFTLLAARLVGDKGRVYAFEPEPRNYDYLVKNIELNNYNNISSVQKAVSDKNGKTKLYICSYDTGHHTINQYEGIEAYKPDSIDNNSIDDKKDFIEIETVTLDSFLKDKEKLIDIIKMDVEGAEVLALSGMDRTLRENKNLKMFVEFFPLLIKEMGSSSKEFINKLLEDYRFSISIVPDDYDASRGGFIRVNSIDELMSFCKGEKDHLNLFVARN